MTEGFRLSPQQKRLWFLQRQAQAAYRAQSVIMIEGRLDVELLKRAVRQIVDRHEILRTTFQRQPGIRTPVQVIAEPAQFSYSWGVDDESASFDFENGPLFRIGLSRLSTNKHLLTVTLSSLCADSSTLKCFYDELCRTYEALLSGNEFDVEAMQYADFAAWQDELLESDLATAGREFWQQRNTTQPSSGLNAFTIASTAPGSVARFTCVRDAGIAEQIDGFTREHACDWSTFLQTCWQTLLWRLTKQSEIVIGKVFDGRSYDELAASYGLIARCVPVAFRLDHDPSFAEHLRETAKDISEKEPWLEFWTWENTGSYFPVSFEYEERSASYNAGDVRFRVYDQFACFDRFNLKLIGVRSHEDATLQAELQYDPQAIPLDAVRCLADQFQELVAAALENPQARLSELRILSSNERQRLVVEVNETSREYDRTALVHSLFEQQVASAAASTAVICDDDSLSYAELNARANQLAHYLQKFGVGPEKPVVLNLERSVETLTGLLAILKAGGAYVPLEGPQPKQRLTAILEETNAPVIVTQSSLKEQFDGRNEQVISIDSDWSTISRESSENPSASVHEDNLAYIIYTSGSTGKAKGVAVEHRQLTNYFYAIRERLSVADNSSYATVSTFAADLGNTMIYLSLCAGGTLNVNTKQQATDAGALIAHARRHETDYLKIVPSHLEVLLAHDGSEALLPRKCLILGGEAAAPDLINLVRTRAPKCAIYNHYGPTETTVGVLTFKVEENRDEQKGLPLGRPLANNTVYVLDQRLNPVAAGETGEIYLGGAQVTRGYVKEAGVTAEKFVPNPFSRQPGERFYRTGDVGRFRPDGNVEFVGRADSQIKLRGYRIELGEIRYALNQHPGISDSVAIVTKDDNDQPTLNAYYIAQQDIEVSELRDFLAEYLGAQAIPNHFGRLAKFPLTPNGKIDLHAIAGIERAERVAPRRVVPTATPMEELLAGVWTNVLGVKQISTDDNFFALGGHSLLATRIVSQLHRLLQIEVPFTVLFESPTIAATAKRLAALLQQEEGLQSPPIVRVPRDLPLQLSFAQQRLWFIDQLQPNSSGYNNTSAMRLTGPLNVSVLERTLNEIIRRHEILRTSFRANGGEPVQVIAPPVEISWPATDLTQREAADREAEVLRIIKEDSIRPFDLAVGPLLRVKILRLGPEEHVLVVTMHHIVTDAWSNEIIMRETSAIYQAFLHDKTSPLPELPVQYADYSSWQHQCLSGEMLEKHLAYWRQQLSGRPPMLELPGDRPRNEAKAGRGAKQTISIPNDLMQELRAFSRQRGVTLFMTLVASFKVLLHFYTKQDDIVIGTDVANRNRTEIEGLIGFFVNQLVLRTNLSGNPAFVELLDRVREVTLGAYAYQDLPFDRLVDALKPERNSNYAPFFQIKLVLENTSAGELELPGVKIDPLETESSEAKLDLILVLRERADGLQGWFEYNGDLFDDSTVARYAEYLELILRNALASPTSRISDFHEAMTSLESKRRELEQQEYENAWREGFKKIKPQPVSLTSDLETQSAND
jgi:amino acid adenylation domain-containing protein